METKVKPLGIGPPNAGLPRAFGLDANWTKECGWGLGVKPQCLGNYGQDALCLFGVPFACINMNDFICNLVASIKGLFSLCL